MKSEYTRSKASRRNYTTTKTIRKKKNQYTHTQNCQHILRMVYNLRNGFRLYVVLRDASLPSRLCLFANAAKKNTKNHYSGRMHLSRIQCILCCTKQARKKTKFDQRGKERFYFVGKKREENAMKLIDIKGRRKKKYTHTTRQKHLCIYL